MLISTCWIIVVTKKRYINYKRLFINIQYYFSGNNLSCRTCEFHITSKQLKKLSDNEGYYRFKRQAGRELKLSEDIILEAATAGFPEEIRGILCTEFYKRG